MVETSSVIDGVVVKVGEHIDIKRSDGRQHVAMISGFNENTKSVTVEWFERGETKGKEVDLDSILTLNPHLSADSQEETNNNNENRVNITKTGSSTTSNGVDKQSNSRAKPHTTSSKQNTGRLTTDRSRSTMNGHSNMEPVVKSSAYMTTTVEESAASKRKSTTMQEIERLKKNREDRRAQQEEQRRHKEELKNVDPGNPNWEVMAMIREYQSTLEYRPLRMNDQVIDNKISVCVRKRPLNPKEKNRREIEVVTVPVKDHVVVHQPQTKVDLTKYVEHQKFRFDFAFDEQADNELVYKFTAQPLVKTVFQQGFATCFAYGQTGSGKTHTMGGDFHGKSQDCSKGIYALTAKDVFKYLNSKQYKGEGLNVSCCFFEIYSGKVFDLLNNKVKLRVLEDGKAQVQVVGLREQAVKSEHDVMNIIKKGSDVRTAGTTSANNNSSRSHAVFQIVLRKGSKLHGKFSLIDLAGNERGVDTMSSDRQTRMEGAEINKSLLALKELGADDDELLQGGGGGARNNRKTEEAPDFGDYEDDGDDMALLQSRNEEELTEEIMSFQLMVNHIQEAEEEVLDEHQAFLDTASKSVKELDKVWKKTGERVDYDVEAYAKALKDALARYPSKDALEKKLDNLLLQMQQEEIAAQKTTQRGKKK